MADSTLGILNQYHKPRFHHSLHKPVAEAKVETLYAQQLGPLTAAVAAHGVTNVWQGVFVVPLANSDEIHVIWVTPHDFDFRYPIFVRWGLLPDNNTSALTIATTVDFVNTGGASIPKVETGVDLAADGATALTETLPAIVAANTTASRPFFSKWGKAAAQTDDWDILFTKLVASGQSGADRLRVFCYQIAYTPRTA